MISDLALGLSTQPKIRAVEVAVLLALGLLVVSYLAPAVVMLAREGGQLARLRRSILSQWRDSRWSAMVERFWSVRAAEPKAPIVAELGRVARAVETCGQSSAERFEHLDRNVAERIEVLRKLGLAEPDKSALPLAVDPSSQRGTVGSVITMVLLALILGGVNAFLLNIFFRERLPSYRVLPYPLPDIEASQILAWLFFIIEVAIGWAIYRNQHGDQDDPQDKRTSTVVFHAIPWFVFVALMVVETIAYAALSQRMQLPQLLNMSNDSALTPLVANAIALFGAAMTMMLAYVGHALAGAIHRHQVAKAARAVSKALRKLQSSSAEVRALNDALVATRTEAASLPTSLAKQFAGAIGTPSGDRKLAVEIQAAVASATRGPNADGTPSGSAVRTRNQVVGDLLTYVAILACALLLGVLARLESQSAFARAFTATWPAAGVGYVCAAVAALTGLLIRSALNRLYVAAPMPYAIAGTRGRQLVGWALVGLAMAVILTHCLLAVIGLSHSIAWLAAAIGLVQGAALIALGMFFDQAFVALWSLLQLAWIGLVWAAIAVALALLGLFELISYASSLLVRLLAVPGDLFRKLLPGRKTVDRALPA